MATGYYNQNYWNANYWQANYWAPTGGLTGDYWANEWWNTNYWNANYWLETNDGDVFQRNAAQLALTVQPPVLNVGTGVQADTENLPLVAYQVDANNDYNLSTSLATLTFTGFTTAVGTEGYQAGDIDIRIVPDATFEVTYGEVASLATLSLGAQVPTITTQPGLAVAASLETRSLVSFVTDASLNIEPPLITAALGLSSFNTTAGVGQQIPASLPSLAYGLPTHTVFGFSPAEVTVPSVPEVIVRPFQTSVLFRDPVFIPDPTFPPDTSIINDNAGVYPSNYEICDRTGFRVRRGGLVREWTGVMVRPESWERRNIQDFVRGVGDEMRGSPRPEQDDLFINEEYPTGVTADDL